MKAELLKILREAEDYVSGQQLCDHFGVSRTAVWKVIRQLQEEGYQIEAVKNRGYLLKKDAVPDVMTAPEIISRLHSRWMGRNCIFLETVDSTNNYLKRAAEDGAVNGTLAVAEEQTGGKGRRGRSWETPKGTNIAMTILLRPEIRPEHASRLTLLMAMAVVRGIQKETGLQAGIKWPNDVVVDGHKVCGILPEEIREIAGSLKLSAGHPVARAGLIASIMEELEDLYEVFLKTEDLSALKDEYNRNCVTCGHEIRVLEPGHEYTGMTDGINDLGELVVKKADGETVCVYAGEVSVRGLYGYV